MLPARATELARIADLHILYRRAASAYAGAITPEVKAELWAQAEKQVPPLKEKTMIDIEQVRSNSEPTEPPAPLKRGDKVRIALDGDEWHDKTGIIRQLRGNGKGGFAQAGIDIAGKYPDSRSERRYFNFEDLIAVPADDAKIDALVEAHEPTFTRGMKVKLMIAPNHRRISVPVGEIGEVMSYQTSAHIEVGFSGYGIEVCKANQLKIVDADEPVAIERPGGDATVGTVVVNPKNPAPAGMVTVQVAPGMIEAAQADEVKTLGDALAELGKAKAELAQRNDTIRRLLDSRKELEKQLDTLARDQQMTPLARTGVWEIMTLTQETIMNEQRIKADEILNNLLKDGWQIVPQLCIAAFDRRTVFLQRQSRMVEPKPEDKPGNVRDFPVPDAELSAEDESKTIASLIVEAAKRRAQEIGLPVSSSYGMGRGLAPRRA